MKHLTREEVDVQRLMRKARRIAVVGASPRADRHSNTVCRFLRRAGFEVTPVRQDRRDVVGLSSYGSLADVPGQLDVAIIYRSPKKAVDHVAEAAARGDLMAVWLPPGSVSDAALDVAAQEGLAVVRDRCPEEEYRHFARPAGHNLERVFRESRTNKSTPRSVRRAERQQRRRSRGTSHARTGSR